MLRVSVVLLIELYRRALSVTPDFLRRLKTMAVSRCIERVASGRKEITAVSHQTINDPVWIGFLRESGL